MTWTPEAIAAIITAATGLVTAVTALLHSIRTRQFSVRTRQIVDGRNDPGQPGGAADNQP